MKKYLCLLLCLISSHLAFAAIHYKNASTNKTAQELFDTGMLNYYGYLYVQAEYDFRQALLYDPQCAICYWGLAIAKKQQALELGQPFAKLGYDDIKRADQLIATRSGFQYDVIQAAKTSFSLDPGATSKQLQINYINSLRDLYNKYKNDREWNTESLALFVDAAAYYSNVDDGIVTTHCGSASNNAYRQEALGLMTPVLKDASYPDHPGILHTYIHMAERRLDDSLGLIAARKLPGFSHGIIAHYAHMPNHIYWRRGMYDKAIQANFNAIKIDENYFKHNGAGLNSYYYEYHYLHSHHFLTALGILTNNYDMAISYARAIKKLMDVSRMQALKDYRDTFFSLEHLVLARFKKWDSVLQLPIPEQTDELGLLFINFSKALAYLHKDQLTQFQELFDKLKNKKYSRKNMLDLQTLAVTYLQAEQMNLKHASLKEMENLFIANHVDKIESSLFPMNPPIWLFPYSLFLSDAAVERSDFKSAKKYHDLYLQLYPKSTLGSYQK